MEQLTNTSPDMMQLSGDLFISQSPSKYTGIAASAVYDLGHELQSICDTFQEAAQAKNIVVSLSMVGVIPVVFWDMDRLREQVFNNILSNAFAYTPPGGRIAVLVNQLDAYTMLIRISDSGSDIPVSERAGMNVSHQELERHYVNGLRSAQLCVQAHQGKLSIVDDPGCSGATFKIEIPLYSLCIQ